MDAIFLCEFCGDHMGEEKTTPRVLRCGHTFCTPCVSEFYGGGKYKCPTCGKHLHSKYFSSIPVNHALLKIMKAKKSFGDKDVNEFEILPEISIEDNPKHSNDETGSQLILHDYEIEKSVSPNEPPQHAGKCNNHGSYCMFWCKSCKEWICHDCFVISHPPLVCEIRTFNHALSEIKLGEDQCIKKTVKQFDNHTEKYIKKQSALKDMREKNRALIKELQRLLSKNQQAKREVEKQTEDIKSILAEGLSTLLTLLESQRQLLEAQTFDKVFSARHQAQAWQSKLLDWHDPNNLLSGEEMGYSDELQKSTLTAIAVLKDLLLSSDNKDIKSQTSGLATVSKKDEEAVARNLNQLLETSEWKAIITKTENNQLSSDNSLQCLANITSGTDVKQYIFGKGIDDPYVVQDKQRAVNSLTCGKFEVLGENLIDLSSNERGFRGRCPLSLKQCLTLDSTEQPRCRSINTHFSVKRKHPISPQLERISETEEQGCRLEVEREETEQFLIEYEKDDDKPQILAKSIELSEEDPTKILPAVSKAELRCTEVEENFPGEFLSKYSRNGLHLLDEDLDSAVPQGMKGKRRDDPVNFRASSSASKVISTANGRDGTSLSGGASSIASRESTITVSGLGNIVSGGIIVVTGEADEDDDHDDDNYLLKEYTCDTVLPLESKEKYEMGRTQWRVKTGVPQEGEYGHNKPKNYHALYKEKGIVFKRSNISGVLISGSYVHADEDTKTMSSGYQTEDLIGTDHYYQIKELTQTESDYDDEIFLTPTSEVGVVHYPIGHNNSILNSDKEARDIGIAYSLESDTTLPMEDLIERQRYIRRKISESNGERTSQLTGAEAQEDNVEDTDIDANKSKIGNKCRLM
ncbi:uncharacterized protein [Palaemon carinicauda]|uniref:uncharacterized protein isoform X2 n=1 Tax=Palaemon carinicauda TaxID=392227 RepID=UPI0035B61966